MHPSAVIDQVIEELDRLLVSIKRFPSRVRAREDRSTIKAHAFSWFNTHQPMLRPLHSHPEFQSLDNDFRSLLELCDRDSYRHSYQEILKGLKEGLVKLRSEATKPGLKYTEKIAKPDFSSLIADKRMAEILSRRWDEVLNCVNHGAPLAATIMIGAMLEAMLLTRINQLEDKSFLFKLKAAPISRSTKKPLPLQEWGLNDYIEISHEIGWIGKTAKDVGQVIRDYRNLVHPAKELSGGFRIENTDARMLWSIFEQLSNQIIESTRS